MLMAGWDTAENGTSVTATERLRGAFPAWRRTAKPKPAPEPAPEHTESEATGLREEHLRLVSDYIVDYPEDDAERVRCNRAFLEPPTEPLERAAG
jgi:hypothetical protein